MKIHNAYLFYTIKVFLSNICGKEKSGEPLTFSLYLDISARVITKSRWYTHSSRAVYFIGLIYKAGDIGNTQDQLQLCCYAVGSESDLMRVNSLPAPSPFLISCQKGRFCWKNPMGSRVHGNLSIQFMLGSLLGRQLHGGGWIAHVRGKSLSGTLVFF